MSYKFHISLNILVNPSSFDSSNLCSTSVLRIQDAVFLRYLDDFQLNANIVVTPARKLMKDMFLSKLIIYHGRNELPFYSKVKRIISIDSSLYFKLTFKCNLLLFVFRSIIIKQIIGKGALN